MAILPTVKLRRVTDGNVIILNQTDYARDLAGYARKGYKIISFRGGTATDAEVLFDKEQSDLEKFRRTDEARQRWSGDAERRFHERAVVVRRPAPPEDPTRSAPRAPQSPPDRVQGASPPDGPPAPPDAATGADAAPPDWRVMKPWAARQRYVQKVTGTIPRSQAHADRLMAGRG